MKKTYINPAMLVVPFVTTHVIANSTTGLNDEVSTVSWSNDTFTGDVADTKGASSSDLWDNEW